MQCWVSLRFALGRRTPLSHFFAETPAFSFGQVSFQGFRRINSGVGSFRSAGPVLDSITGGPVSQRRSNLCGLACAASSSSFQEATELVDENSSNRQRKKLRRESAEFILKLKLDLCAKEGDLREALDLYDEARKTNVCLNHHHYNMLLYVCSLAASPGQVKLNGENINDSYLSLKRGFEIYQDMIIDNVTPDEATFTNVARLAVAAEDPEMAFNLIHQMKACNIQTRLRSYEPALIGFCKKGLTDRAYEVDRHMIESGLTAEEPELSALLKLSADHNKAEKVYELLHRLRATVRQVTESTSNIISDWFDSDNASQIGEENMDIAKIKEGVFKGGGGWHGQGWMGNGKWRVVRTEVDDSGICQSCNQRLACIDIDTVETENFATSVSNFALQREKMENFGKFKEWLESHGPFDAVIDAANVGLMNGKSFNFHRLASVVNHMHNLSSSKRYPLIILHRNRATDGPARRPNSKRLMEIWSKAGAFYVCPFGSNDDWYWLYAAVSNKCLLVTNDEMRDHIFQLLGTSFFPRWKEKHQIRLSLSEQGLKLHMPPPYSIVIQESENGDWHVPTVVGDDLESRRQWICCTRSRQTNRP